ncbi:uncharacterized protein LOC126975696 [Leptidea sinapis]|uniref:uncharacterized protein LOC126975696 n=1 Tax=Leptidea sinapis TaxID=189913 RepID=UPI00213C7953|nr:uncharacterized protein LOC126975696 [Leptidea sinapis]
MDNVNRSKLLLLRPDSRETALKRINLDETQFKVLVEIFKKWAEQQPHFKKKDFNKNHYEMLLLNAKGSVERAKKIEDKYNTFRSLMPEFFSYWDLIDDYKNIFKLMMPILLPKLTSDHHRVYVVRIIEDFRSSEVQLKSCKLNLLQADYMKYYDFSSGLHIIIDCFNVNLLEVFPKMDVILLKKLFTILMEGYGMRVLGIYYLTTSKLIDSVISLVKQALKPKVASRISVLKTYEDLYKFVDRDILPIEMGGSEKSISEIHEDWYQEFSSDDFKAYLHELEKVGTNEELRPSDKFNDEYAGMPGTFRVLNVD